MLQGTDPATVDPAAEGEIVQNRLTEHPGGVAPSYCSCSCLCFWQGKKMQHSQALVHPQAGGVTKTSAESVVGPAASEGK